MPAPDSRSEARAWLVLARAPGLRAGALHALLEAHGDAAGILSASPRAWRAAGLGDETIGALAAPDPARIAADLAWFDQPSHHLVPIDSPAYPPLLRQIPDPPPVLFLAGDPAALATPQLAIVGSRSPTHGGRETAEAFAAALARAGLTITSGLALGIDGAAHRGALAAGGRTIAVLGSGPDVIYPASHAALAREVAGAGAVVSELPPGTPPRREHFPKRNRIISGLALGTLVVEASERSGSLITARLAGEQGRELFAIPGSIHNPLARGCHRLIREGAKLVEQARDVLEELGPLAGVLVPPDAPADGAPPDAGPDPEYGALLDALGHDPCSVDTLVRRSGLTADVVSSMLLLLELRGDVQLVPGGLYARRAARNPYGST
jgi:DNA processing protein